MKKRRNPYASRLKKQVTIRMGTDIVACFKAMAEESWEGGGVGVRDS